MATISDLAPWAICSVLFITTVLIGSFLASAPHTDAEPPLLKPGIPWGVGHIIRLLWDRAVFFRNIHDQVPKPIVSLPLGPRRFGLGKSYVIFNPSLQKAAMTHKNMDPRDTSAAYIPPLYDIKKSTLMMLMGKDGVHESLTHPMHEVFQNTLKGEHLNTMTFKTLEFVTGALESVGSGDGALRVPSLYYWLRGMMTQAISAGLYGIENNPFLPAEGEGYEMVETFWDFLEDQGALSMGVLPSIIARKGYLARAKLADVMVPYYMAKHYEGEAVSALVKERARLFLEWDMPVDEMAKQELAVMANGVSNTVPTLFWMAFHVFSRPESDLVQRLRTEVCRHIAVLRDTDGQPPPADAKVISIKYSTIMDTCPLLASCFREGARLTTPNMTLRQVLADTVLSGDNGQTWLLKEGNMVVLPGEFLHRDKAIWGADADEFNPDRFMPDPARNKETDRLRTISYVPFGGGKHLCPGRRFALAETLSFMAALVLGFEIEGLDPKKIRIQWPLMAQASRPVPGYEGGPVTIRRRKGWEHVKWTFEA